jgi:hypothetical protein
VVVLWEAAGGPDGETADFGTPSPCLLRNPSCLRRQFNAGPGLGECALSVRSAVPGVPKTVRTGAHICGHFGHSGPRIVSSSPTRLTTPSLRALREVCAWR